MVVTDIIIGSYKYNSKSRLTQNSQSFPFKVNTIKKDVKTNLENTLTKLRIIEDVTPEEEEKLDNSFLGGRNEKKGKKKGENELTQIEYNIPGSCQVSVLYKNHSLADRTVQVAQLGIDVALPKSMFTGAELPKIIFSDKTGNIVSISK